MYNMAHIELTDQCNLKCKMCKAQKGKTIIDMNQFESILHQLAYLNCSDGKINIRNIELNGHGEALLYPHLKEAVKLAKKFFPHISLVTNGTLLNPDISSDLLQLGINKITISITGSNAYIYKKFQGYKVNSDSFLKVMNNVKELISLKKKLRSKTDICLAYIMTTDNMDDLHQYIRYWKKQGIDRIFVNPMIEYISSCRKYRRCYHIGNKIFISSNGDMRPCCYDFDRKLTMGNIWDTQNGIRDILTDKKHLDLINANKKCQFQIMPDSCKHCILMSRFPLPSAYRFRVRIIYNKGFFDFILGNLFEKGIFLYSCLPNVPAIYNFIDKIKNIWNPI
ncbi:MAG: radical SAM protein [Lachnospiraceae bacterium]|nr:radical SAM protein [Lachnospiraceae bacterium]